MTLVTELDPPAFAYTAPDFAADRHHGPGTHFCLGANLAGAGLDALPLRWTT